MQFNPGRNKQANEVIFSCKLVSNNLTHPSVKFNNNNVTKYSHLKHLGFALHLNITFSTHIDQKLKSGIK